MMSVTYYVFDIVINHPVDEIPAFVRTTTSRSVEAFFEKGFPFSTMQRAHRDSAFFQDRAILIGVCHPYVAGI
jgi:hypothetical protein